MPRLRAGQGDERELTHGERWVSTKPSRSWTMLWLRSAFRVSHRLQPSMGPVVAAQWIPGVASSLCSLRSSLATVACCN